jgi:N-acyl homoserine lactone hydrolase
MSFKLKTLLMAATTVAFSWAGLTTGAKAESPQGMKLYVFSSGFLNIDKSALQAGAAPGKIDVPVGFFLIHHPKGNVLFDCGNNDKVITDPTYWGPLAAMLGNPANNSRSPDVAVDAQLEKAGYKISDVNYVVLGHMHLDHAQVPERDPGLPARRDHQRVLAEARVCRTLHPRRPGRAALPRRLEPAGQAESDRARR